MTQSNLVARFATDDDISLIQDIVNSNLLALNPQEKRIGELEAKELVHGFVDQAATRLTKFEGDEKWQSFLTLNPDFSRSRFYLDIYTRPGSKTLPKTLELAIEIAKAGSPEFQLWIGIQSNDLEYRNLLEGKGFGLLRRYWTMQMDLPSAEKSIKSTGSIREIDLDNPQELRSFYSVNQDSFSKHFGFMPRAYEDWCELVLRHRAELGTRIWLIAVDGKDVGFLDCDDSLLHEECGYVSGLGVRLDFHGRGLGETLLRHAISINSALNRKKLCLNVDAGNESGALRLYEKVGMKPISEWHQYENLNWSKLI
jgi:ribosomal protein S18 acetylase RimI-like enzyme